MSKNLNSYSKGEGKESERPIIKKTEIRLDNHIQSVVISVAHDYLKKDIGISSSLFLIISGGEKKERQYFSCILNNPQYFARIKVHFLTKEGEGFRTKELLETANELKARLKDSEVDSSDSFFLLSDRDHFYPEIVEIKPECDSKRYHLVVSNPCFEIWLYYTSFNLMPHENGFVIPPIKQISNEFKRYLDQKGKETGGIDPRKAIFEIQHSIANCKANYKEDKNGIPELFSTNMYELAEELLPLIEPELNKLMEDNDRKEEEFRNKNKK